jgi:hypothetical protein
VNVVPRTEPGQDHLYEDFVHPAPEPAPAAAKTFSVPVSHEGQGPSAAHQGIYRTQVLDATQNPVINILGRDYERTSARVGNYAVPGQSAGGYIVLSQSREIAEQVLTQYTQSGAFNGPVGAWVPSGVERVIDNCDELWATLVSAAPSYVSVIVNRKLPVKANQAG